MLRELTRVDKGLIFGWAAIIFSSASLLLPQVNTSSTLTLAMVIILLSGLPFGILGLIGLVSGINISNDEITGESR